MMIRRIGDCRMGRMAERRRYDKMTDTRGRITDSRGRGNGMECQKY